MGFEGARHMIPERLPSARRERTVGCRVIDLTQSTIVNIQALAGTLRRLDLSNLNLEMIDQDIVDGLVFLERIVLNHNRITENSFPDNFGQFDNLVELSVHDNQLKQLPKVIRKLRSLHRLKLSENQLTKLDGIEKLKKLQLLVLDDNKLDCLSKEFFANVKKLEYLHCANNSITGLPSDIRNLRHLTDLNISNNNLSYLPPEVFVLPRIEIINACCNQINRVPTLNIKGHLKRKLTSIDLSDNLLARFPAHLMFMTNKLDLSQNKIKTIPLSLIDKLDQVPDLKLLLGDNPMTLPPQDICDCGLHAIIQYFMEIKTDMRIYQGIKVLVLGASDQGKSSLVQSMLDQQSRLTEHERTLGVDVYDHSIDLEKSDNPLGKHLNLSIWDFSGNQRYLFQHQYFLQTSSLALLVFNMAEYDDSKFKDIFGAWIDWIVSRTNRLIAIPVGTNTDKLRPAKIKSISVSVMNQIENYIKETRDATEKEIKRIESKPYISPALSEQLKLYISLTKLETVIHDTVITVSSKNYTGVQELEDAIVKMAENQEIFPNVLREIPSLWGEVVNFVDDQGYAMQIPMMQWDDYATLVTSKFGMRHLIHAMTEYMHDTGKIIWFSSHPTLKDYVFLRPSWLTDIFKSLFRHDIAEIDYNTEESFKQHNITSLKLEKMKKEVAEEGTLDREFVKCLWANVFQTDTNRPVLEVLAMLLDHFQIGYASSTKPQRRSSAVSTISRASTVDRPDRDILDSLSVTSRPVSSRKGALTPHQGDRLETMSVATNRTKTTEKSDEQKNSPPKISKVCLPWLVDVKQPLKFKDDHQLHNANPNIAAVFRFPKYIPPGLFELLTIRAQQNEFELQNLYHWKTGLYARHMQENIRFYLQKIDHDDGSTCVRTEARHEAQAVEDETQPEKEVEQLWQLLLPFLKDCEDIIAKYAGR